jgi:hypothetical protein
MFDAPASIGSKNITKAHKVKNAPNNFTAASEFFITRPPLYLSSFDRKTSS